ncbi:MAG TPA: extracellular solute-binding protein [Pseudogracilibacillus sp.]|nr:extracellular solute-binding protein [Pseudogracilibacillus sp.]
MKFKKTLFLIMTLLLVVVLAACGGNNNAGGKDNGNNDGGSDDSNVNTDGFPIVDEELDLDFFAKHPVQQSGAGNDWNDILIWNEYKDETNVNIKWDLIEEEGLEDRRNLSLHDKLPDAYFQADFSMSDLITYGEQGLFIELNDLIEEHAPNLSALMDEEPGIRKGITFPNGKIYSLPAIVDPDFLSVRLAARPWINEEHLELVGMDMPETTDEFYEFLKAIKEEAPAGENTIPYGGTAIAELEQWLSGSFGVMNRGQVNTNFDEDPDNPGDVRFYAASEGYKEMLEYLHKLYSEGLIDQQILDNDWGHFTGLAGEESEAFSAYVFYEPVDFFGEEVGSKWTHMTALEGPNGDRNYNKVGPIVWDVSNLVITSENPNPEATVRWMDHFYSEEGQQLYYMGVEGETFEEEGGEEKYVADLTNENGGPDEEAIMQHLTWVGAINGVLAEDYFHGGESNAASVAASDDIEAYVPDTIWDRFTFDEEENEILSNQGTEINQYVEEMRDKFIAGQESLDNFDNYVETLEKMGLQEVIDAYQAAFDRYQEN